MKKFCLLLILIILVFSLSSCNYRDLDKVLFVTAVIIDEGEQEGTVSLYFEAFRPSSSAKQEEAGGERIVYGVKNKEPLEAVDDLSKLANLHFNFAQTKVLLFTRAAAEKGLNNYINLFTHWEEFTIRTFIAIWDGDPDKFGEVELKGETFMGIYLRTHIQNAEKSTSHVRTITILELMNAAQVKGKVQGIPIILPVKKEQEQLISIDEVALIRDYKMVGVLTAQEGDVVNYMAGQIRNSFIETDNPDSEEAKIILNALSCKIASKITPVGERMKIEKHLRVNALMRGAQKHFTADKVTFDKIKKQAAEDGLKEIYNLYDKYSSMGIDVYNLGEAIYRKYPWFDQENLFDKIDFSVSIDFVIQGTNYNQDFNPMVKHNQQ